MMLIPGVTLLSTKPILYEVTYLNGTYQFSEPFAILRVDENYVTAAGMSIGAALTSLEIELAVAGGIGAVVVAAIEKLVSLVVNATLNNDGSLTLAFANHWCGTELAGIDPTACGVPADWWEGVVYEMLNSGTPRNMA